MKKAMKILTLMFFVSVAITCLVTAQTTNPWSTGSTGYEKNSFTTLDDVYVKSNVICEPAPSQVDVYIVENSDQWVDGTDLVDASGAFEGITLRDAKIPLTKIWDSPKAGVYDIVVDCNKDGKYNSREPVDNFYREGFAVTAIAGMGKAEVGATNPGNHTWMYDPEDTNFVSEVLQLKLSSDGENVELKNITIRATGSGDDAQIDKLEIYADENANGIVDEGEGVIGDSQPAYFANDATMTLSLEAVLNAGTPESILIVYTMKQTTPKGEFVSVVESVSGLGEDSKKAIAFSGLPITSNKISVLSEKTCLGELALDFNPNPAQLSKKVTAALFGLSGCQNKTIILRLNECGSSLQERTGSCVLANDSCNISFNSLATLNYYACIDKNDDGDMNDSGESAVVELEVFVPASEVANLTVENTTEEESSEEELTTEENVTGIESATPVTGETVGLWGKISTVGESGSFFILLEVTLLLILFVLIMTMFRLKGGRKKEE